MNKEQWRRLIGSPGSSTLYTLMRSLVMQAITWDTPVILRSGWSDIVRGGVPI